MRAHAASFVTLACCFGGSADGATYQLEQLTAPGAIAEGPAIDGVPGLHVGSMLAFKADCVNVDLTGIEDATGKATMPGAVFALEVDRREPFDPDTEPARMYFLQHDGTQRFPFKDGRFAWIIAEHFIEHVPYPAAVAFLAEARRLLAPGGTLRLSTPDLAIYAAAYFDPAQVITRLLCSCCGTQLSVPLPQRPETQTEREPPPRRLNCEHHDSLGKISFGACVCAFCLPTTTRQRFFKEHYATMTEGPEMAANKAWLSPRKADMFNQIFYGYGHKHVYDELELRAAAAAGGWNDDGGGGCGMRVGRYREGVDAALALLDDAVHRDESFYLDL
jgi:SAM-dependent methyltransferase